METAATLAMITRFIKEARRAWLLSINMAIEDWTRVEEAADRFGSLGMSQSIEAGYGEVRYQTGGYFDPAKVANRLSVGKMSLVARFLADVRESAVSGMIGLNARQIADLTSYHRVLAGSLSDAIDSGKPSPINQKDIDRQVRAKYNMMTSARAQAVAADTARASVGLGVDLALYQLSEQGIIINRTWNTMADNLVRGSHAPMNGQVRPTGQPFISGNGYSLLHPHDYQAPASETSFCRCYLTTERHRHV